MSAHTHWTCLTPWKESSVLLGQETLTKSAGCQCTESKIALDARRAIFLFETLDNTFEETWMIFGDRGKDFSIKSYVCFFEFVHECGVVHSKWSHGCIDAYLEETAEGTFFVSTISVSIDACFEHCWACETNFGFATPHHALHLFHQTLSALDVLYATFDSSHIRSWVYWELNL